jgi:uncharacterized membrane protein
MWAATTIVTAFALALVAMSFAFGVGIVGVPVAILLIAAAGLFDLRRRSTQARLIDQHRERAKERKVEFTERDRETVVPDRSRSSGGG